mgnify:CR=1 FL=1
MGSYEHYARGPRRPPACCLQNDPPVCEMGILAQSVFICLNQGSFRAQAVKSGVSVVSDFFSFNTLRSFDLVQNNRLDLTLAIRL